MEAVQAETGWAKGWAGGGTDPAFSSGAGAPGPPWVTTPCRFSNAFFREKQSHTGVSL